MALPTCSECEAPLIEVHNRHGTEQVGHDPACSQGPNAPADIDYGDRGLRDEPPEEILTAVGAITIAAGRAEFMSRTLLRLLAGMPSDLASHLTGRQGWAWVIERLAQLAAHRAGLDSSLREAIAEWADIADRVRVERNVFTHSSFTAIGTWDMRGEEPSVVMPSQPVFMQVRSKRTKQEPTLHAAGLGRLWSLAHALEWVETEGSALTTRVREAVGDEDLEDSQSPAGSVVGDGNEAAVGKSRPED